MCNKYNVNKVLPECVSFLNLDVYAVKQACLNQHI